MRSRSKGNYSPIWINTNAIVWPAHGTSPHLPSHHSSKHNIIITYMKYERNERKKMSEGKKNQKWKQQTNATATLVESFLVVAEHGQPRYVRYKLYGLCGARLESYRLIKQWTNMILMNWYEFIIFSLFVFRSPGRPPNRSCIVFAFFCSVVMN